MDIVKRSIDVLTLGSDRPLRRLAAYYAILGIVGYLVLHFSPKVADLFPGERFDAITKAPLLLQDGFKGVTNTATATATTPEAGHMTSLTFGLTTALAFVSSLFLMLPVTWVYMSVAPGKQHNQSIVETLLLMPMVVAGIVLVVQNSLALAFSLAGVVAAVRFRTNLNEARDTVFVFLAIAVGFSVGVHVIMAAVYLTVIFNFVLLALWQSGFGRNVLVESNAQSRLGDSLSALATKTKEGPAVPDRDLVLALTPKKVDALSQRFERLRKVMGPGGKKPRFNAVVTVTANDITEAQQSTEKALDAATKRWKLDEVVTNTGKPSEIYYLVRTRKSVPRDALLTQIRQSANGSIAGADVEVGEALAIETHERRTAKKQAAKNLDVH